MFTNRANKSLNTKFMLNMALVALLMFVLLVTYEIFNSSSRLVKFTRDRIETLARNGANNAEYGVLTKNYTLLDNITHGIISEKDVVSVAITDSSGSILSSKGQAAGIIREISLPIKSESKAGKEINTEDMVLGIENREAAREEIIGMITVKYSLEDIFRQIRMSSLLVLGIVLVVFLIAAVISYYTLKKLLLPLENLVAATEDISKGKFDTKVITESRDEIGKLADSFNSMSAKLSETVVSKDYVDNLIESMVDMLIVLGQDLKIKTVNRAVTNLLGYKYDELAGKPIGAVMHQPDSIYTLTWQGALMEMGGVNAIEEEYRQKNGKTIPVILSGAVLRSPDGKFQGILILAKDITQKKISDELIKQSEERYRELFETVPEIIFSISLPDCKIVSLNPAFEKISGLKPSEWIGRDFVDVVFPDDVNFIKGKLEEHIAKGGIFNYELRLLKSDGSYFTGDLTTALRNENGKPVNVFGVVRDITEKRKMEAEKDKLSKQLLQSEKLAAVGQLAGGVAHEINNPLGVILGFSQSLMRGIKDDHPLFMPLQSIEREAKRSKNLVQDLLTFSRVGKAEKENCVLKDVVNGALTLVEAQTKVRSVELIREFSDNLTNAFINRNQIQQIIINLANNAIDAMPKGGTLTIRTLLHKENGTDYVVIQVQDTGSGIPKDIQTKIFEPFFTTKEVGKGTGLGLALVYEIVQKHKGRIEIDSEEGRGTVFEVFLPAEGK